MSSGRRRRRSSAGLATGRTNKLWPYAKIKAGVLVLNNKAAGQLSDIIEFETPEGVPGVLGSLKVTEHGSSHLAVEWQPPLEPNGVIVSYDLFYTVAPPATGQKVALVIDIPTTTRMKLQDLAAETSYVISVRARTRIGPGALMDTIGDTRPAGNPDKPVIAKIEVGVESANVSWNASKMGELYNPGSRFYVEHRKLGTTSWNKTSPDIMSDENWANITDLEPGETYEFRVVAVNGAGLNKYETASDPLVAKIGEKHVETPSPPAPIVEPVRSRASTPWFIGLMCAIIFLLIILIIICCIRRNRGQMYPVYEKERLCGRDPYEKEEPKFGEFTSPGPHYRSQGSLDSEEKPLDSESDSLGEYEYQDTSKFNEDGSFIGQYTGKKNQPNSYNYPPNQTPYNTFV